MKKSIVILGGGISALSQAWFTKQTLGDGAHITLIEKSHRLGGWIRTIKQEGFLFEQGPHSCRTKGPGVETLRLIQALKMEDQIILGSEAAHQRYLYWGQKLRPLPQGIASLVGSPWMWRFIPPILTEWMKPKRNSETDETVYDFISRRFNSQMAEVLVDPLITGIYAGDIRQLSLRSCFPSMHQWEQESGSILKGTFRKKPKIKEIEDPFIKRMQKSSLFTLRDGMQSLVHALDQKLDIEKCLSTNIKALRVIPQGMEVVLEDRVIHADQVISTIPATALSSLLSPLDPSLGHLLDQWKSTSVAVINLGYRNARLPFAPGFGYLIPSSEGEKILGVLWDSHAFPEQNQHPDELRLTVMIGGVHMTDFDCYTEEQMIERALEAVGRHLHLKQKPDAMAFSCASQAIPQYTLGHAARVKQLEQSIAKLSPYLTIAGSSFYGVALNDCISKASLSAKKES